MPPNSKILGNLAVLMVWNPVRNGVVYQHNPPSQSRAVIQSRLDVAVNSSVDRRERRRQRRYLKATIDHASRHKPSRFPSFLRERATAVGRRLHSSHSLHSIMPRLNTMSNSCLLAEECCGIWQFSRWNLSVCRFPIHSFFIFACTKRKCINTKRLDAWNHFIDVNEFWGFLLIRNAARVVYGYWH